MVSDVEEAGLGEGGYLVVIAKVVVGDEPKIAVCWFSWGERE